MSKDAPISILLPSFLVGTLKYLGPVLAPRRAGAFLALGGKEREVFLPFFYRWFDERQRAQDHALRLIRAAVEREHFAPPRVFHAPFLSRRPLPLRYKRNLSDPRRVRENSVMLRRECAFLGRVRRELGIEQSMLYVIHLGQRFGTSAAEALSVAVESLRPSLEVARDNSVILSIENVADRLRDRECVGARLREVEDALGALGGVGHSSSPVGWTYDIAHALLGHGGNVESVRAETQSLLSSLVHIHINSPRLHISEQAWADQHEAPQESSRSVWELFRLACTGPRLRELPVITYEVSWALPGLRPLLGGSPLREVIHGYDLVQRAAYEALGAREETPDTVLRQRSNADHPWSLPAGALAGSGA